MRDLKSDNDQIKAISSKQGKISVAMFGFPAFESESADTENKTDTERNFMFESLQRTTFSGKKIADLPGTKDELDFLQKKLTKKKIKSEVFIREDASEEKIKQIASPAILHIATHGFFMPEADKSKLKNAEEHVEAQRLRNAMMRSGLLLAGCANPAYSNEDGILTALEVMDLNLLNTELVALSACETGLGDNRGSEGVWGLKSAFQQAGARTVLISLWKVSDEATQYLMSAFYTALLSGESKRQALKTAQMKTRAKYKHPYFWGGFVMQGS
jgi:CHAT domain-containing protein